MSLYLRDPDVELHLGDALEVLRELPDESVHCVATSPPFFGLRDYGVDGQIGLEASPDEWASRLVEVFREARRVLRRDGSLWIECGDSYHGGIPGGSSPDGPRGGRENVKLAKSRLGRIPGLKPKDLIGQPFLLAFALRADGWYWRGCNIWAKPNAMPESAKDRCTVAHSYVLHFSKSARYFFDGDAISEPYIEPERVATRTEVSGPGTHHYDPSIGGRARGPDGRRKTHVQQGEHSVQPRNGERWPNPNGRHPRSVWTIPTQGFPEAHFATWPEALARRIILAAVPEWVCEVCGKARERIVERSGVGFFPTLRTDGRTARAETQDGTYARKTAGWTDCECDISQARELLSPTVSKYRPGVVLDPFAGSGTTCYVARKLGRRAIGIDLNESYLEMAARRLQQQSLFAHG